MDLVPYLLLAAAVAAFWHHNLKARESAVATARRACRETGLQLLDDSVQMLRLRPSLERGRPGFKRIYRFEFSADGESRHQGFIFLRGAEVENVVFEEA